MKALLFPGQGSQKVGMALELVQKWPWAQEMANETDRVLGRSLTSICFQGPESELKKTIHTQPAIFFTSALLIEAVRREGLGFDAVAGHSLGEYSALYAANVADEDLATGNEMVDRLKELAEKEGAKVVVVSAQVESELVELDDEERRDFLADLGVELESCGLRALVRNAYDLLQLQTYYTSGPTETRAWTIRKGWTAPKAAGVIHNDFERGFIRAETISYEDLVAAGSEANAKAKGLLRSEGKDYVVQEGDIILFRFNV